MNNMTVSIGVVEQLSTVLIGLISTGAVFRLIFCFIRMATDEEQRGMYMKRAKYTGLFVVLSATTWVLKDLILRYFA